ncbi:MAG: O-antigen ligase family protein [Nitrospirota bacterium]
MLLLLGIAIIILQPRWILYVVFFVASIANIYVMIQSKSGIIFERFFPIYFVGPIIFAGYFMKVLAFKENLFIRREINMPLILFVLWATLSVLWSQNPPHGYYQSIRLIMLFLILFVIANSFNDRKVFLKALWFIFFLGVVISTLNIISLLVDPYKKIYNIADSFYMVLAFSDRGKRATGIGPPALSSVYLTLSIFLSIALAALMKGRMRWFTWIGILFMMYGQFITRTRTGMIALWFGVILVIYVLFKRHAFIRMVFLWTLAFVLVFILSIAHDYERGLKRFSTALDVQKKGSLAIRLDLWKKGFDKLINSYGIGAGIGGYHKYTDKWPHSHNIHLSVLFDLGIIGFAFWLWLIIGLYKLFNAEISKETRHYSDKIALLALSGGFVGVALHGMLDFEYILEGLWVYMGITMAFFNILYREENKEAYQKHDIF